MKVIKEVFVSTDYSYKLRQKKLSEVKYVSSGWQPDIEYYIRNEIKPKIYNEKYNLIFEKNKLNEEVNILSKKLNTALIKLEEKKKVITRTDIN